MIALAAQEKNRVQKVREDANVKIGDVLSDVFGLSGQRMLEALVKGLENNPEPSAMDIALLAKGHAKKKIGELTAALEKHQMRKAHRLLISHAMRHMAFLAEEIDSLDREIVKLIGDANLTPAYQLLQTIPGIREQAAATILAESGPDMKQFPTPANFSSWSGLAPGNNESAGKRKRAPAMKGSPPIKTALVEAGWSASRTNDSEFQHRYQRQKEGLGHKRAIVGSGHALALCVYEVLASGLPYTPKNKDLKPKKIDRLVRHHSRRLHCLQSWLKKIPQDLG